MDCLFAGRRRGTALVVIARSADYPKALMVPYFNGQR
jgi:hypothetical protein